MLEASLYHYVSSLRKLLFSSAISRMLIYLPLFEEPLQSVDFFVVQELRPQFATEFGQGKRSYELLLGFVRFSGNSLQ